MSSEQKNYPTNLQERDIYRNEKLKEIRSLHWDIFDHLPRFVIQLIPETEQIIDLQKPENQTMIDEKLKPFHIKGFDFKPGRIEGESYTVKNSYVYAKLYKDGRLEIVRASYTTSDAEIKFIPVNYEQEIKEAIKQGLDLLETLGVNPPLYGTIIILDSKGYRLKRDSTPQPEYSKKEIEAENTDIKGREFIVSDYEAANKNLDNYTQSTFDYVRRIVS